MAIGGCLAPRVGDRQNMRLVDHVARQGGESPAAGWAVGDIPRLWANGSAQRPPTSLAAAESMDGEPVAALAQATLSGMEGLFCAAAVSRPPEASTGPLERRLSPISASTCTDGAARRPGLAGGVAGHEEADQREAARRVHSGGTARMPRPRRPRPWRRFQRTGKGREGRPSRPLERPNQGVHVSSRGVAVGSSRGTTCGRNAHCCAPAQIQTWSLNNPAATSGD